PSEYVLRAFLSGSVDDEERLVFFYWIANVFQHFNTDGWIDGVSFDPAASAQIDDDFADDARVYFFYPAFAVRIVYSDLNRSCGDFGFWILDFGFCGCFKHIHRGALRG